jgi:DNA-binding NarL/FixJ family response regulator
MDQPINVLLADDHPLIREGIGNTLRKEKDLRLVGEAGTGGTCLELCRTRQPDVLLLDLDMPGPPPLELIALLRQGCPHLKVVVLSAHDDYISVHALLVAGVHGYVLKDEPPPAIIRAIRTVVEGGSWFSQTITRQLAHPTLNGPQFTSREEEVLHLLAKGRSNDEMAEELSVTERTVRYHLHNIYRKIDAETRNQAIVWAVRQNYGKG